MHISNIYKREQFRQKSLISDVVNGIICGLGVNGYILAINAMQELIKMEIDKKVIKKLIDALEDLKKSLINRRKI